MPVIIKRQGYQRWLEPGDPNRLPIDLIRVFDSEKMKACRVDRRLNNVKNNDASLCQPIEPIEDNIPSKRPASSENVKRKAKPDEGDQLSMF